MKIPLNSATGAVVVVVASLLVYWVASNSGVQEVLARHGLTVRSAETSGYPGSEVLGFRRELRGEAYGAGAGRLNYQRFLARNGQELVLDYEAAVHGGFLRLSVHRGRFIREELWSSTVRADGGETLRLPVPKTGLYQLTVTQFGHTGSYRVGWRLERP